MFRWLAIFLILLACSTDSGWKHIDSLKKCELYIKLDSIAREDNLTKFWLACRYDKPDKLEDGHVIDEILLLVTGNCQIGTLTYIHGVFSLKGQTVKRMDIQNREKQLMIPDSSGYELLQFACNYRDNRKSKSRS